MFARRLTLQLKPNMKTDFTKAIDNNILPLLRKQKGFQDTMIFAGSATNEAFAVSLWDGKENAEAYGRTLYPELLKGLSNFIEGTPRVDSFDLLASTLSKKVAGATA